MELFDSFCDDYNKETISASHTWYIINIKINDFGEPDKIRGTQFFQCRMHHLYSFFWNTNEKGNQETLQQFQLKLQILPFYNTIKAIISVTLT
jgi:hypothetical protein